MAPEVFKPARINRLKSRTKYYLLYETCRTFQVPRTFTNNCATVTSSPNKRVIKASTRCGGRSQPLLIPKGRPELGAGLSSIVSWELNVRLLGSRSDQCWRIHQQRTCSNFQFGLGKPLLSCHKGKRIFKRNGIEAIIRKIGLLPLLQWKMRELCQLMIRVTSELRSLGGGYLALAENIKSLEKKITMIHTSRPKRNSRWRR